MLFYCDFREDQKEELRGLVLSLPVQLFHHSKSYSGALSSFYLDHSDASRHPSGNALIKCLAATAGTTTQLPDYRHSG